MKEVRINIDGIECRGHEGDTILNIARACGIEIPTLCYDERMEVYGSCGLCVVEVEGRKGVLRSCATMAADGMIVHTDSPNVVSSRETALQLLVSDHVGDCIAPCVRACPGSTDCQGYVGLVANGQIEEAVALVKEKLPFPAIIGRVCPHPCEEACRRQLVEEPISIAYIKRYMGDFDINSEDPFMPDMEPPTGKSVGIIGGGPSGLSAAYYLLMKGHAVTVYDQMPKMGGMLRYGIPEYRLPTYVIDEEVGRVQTMGAVFKNNIKIGKDRSLDEIRKSHDAVYVAVGAWKSSALRCKGEELEGVIGGIDFLRKAQLNEPLQLGKRVAVVGGGNTAMDACRTAVRMGAENVYILYRRTIDEMPAEEIEIVEAQEEGVEFRLLVSPIEILGENGRVKSILLQKMQLGEPDASGRRRPEPIEGAIEELPLDTVIAAIGQQSQLEGLEQIEVNKWGNVISDEKYFSTNLEGVFAGGDVINRGADIAIKAIGDGEKATHIIDGYLNGEKVAYRPTFIVERHDFTEKYFEGRERILRSPMPNLDPKMRSTNFEEVALGFDQEAAMKDANRCLSCGCHDQFECKLFQYANDYDIDDGALPNEPHFRGVPTDRSHPYILYNPDKCVLCGLCVRICEDVMDNGALGLTKRGFDTIVRPSLDKPLAATSCIACGQCVSVCPVGAFQEIQQFDHSTPLAPTTTHTVCSYCSVGCNIELSTHGDLILTSRPDLNSPVDDGYLCVRGRFGYEPFKPEQRLTVPLARTEEGFTEIDWETAIRHIARQMQSTQVIYGGEATAIAVNERMSNETMYLAKKYATEYLHTDNITSFGRRVEGIADVIGYDASTVSLDEMAAAEVALLVGSDIYNDHTIAALKLKRAVDHGCKLTVMNDASTHADAWASSIVRTDKNDFLKEVLYIFLTENNQKLDEQEVKDALASLGAVKPSEEAKQFAETYAYARAAVIVYDDATVSTDTKRLIAMIAAASGQIAKGRRGILALKAKNNSQGAVDIGIDKPAEDVRAQIEDGTIKALFAMGEDVEGLDTSKLRFFVCCDTVMTETCEKADIILPIQEFSEQSGTYTNLERRIQRFDRAFDPENLLDNWQIFSEICKNLRGGEARFESQEDVTREMLLSIPNYTGLKDDQRQAVWPIGKPEVYLSKGFPTDSGKPHLVPVSTSNLKVTPITTDINEKEMQRVAEFI